MEKNGLNNIIRIPTSLESKFFRYWLEFLAPFHGLTSRELDVATAFLRQRYELSKAISDDNILDRVTMGDDTKQKIREECNITTPHFQVIMGKLRKAKFIIDNRINPRFIPLGIKEGDNSFKLLLYFDFNTGRD